jgi:putative ATP-dependent endonuclease of OLD family
MRVADISIRGFRGIREAYLRFGNHTVLIGPNNCGKTTVIEAVALLLGRDRLIRELTEHDFFGSNPAPGDRMNIVATISDFEPNEPRGHPDWFRNDRAVPKWLDPSDGSLYAESARPELKLACQIAFAARFDRDDLNVETARYFYDDDDAGDVFDPDVVRHVPSALIREMGFFLVPTNRTWDRTISFGSELFRRVVSSIGGRPASAVLAERDRLRNPTQPMEEDTGLSEIVTNIDNELKGLFSDPPSLKLRLTATDSESVLDALMPHYSVRGGLNLPARRQGSGLVSLQHLMLLLHFGRLRAERGEGFLLALEEPELHVPPPLQRRLVHRIQALSTQTIIATHSPIVSAVCEPANLLVLHNRDGVLTSPPLLDETLERDAPNWKRTLYIAKRQELVTALMHDVVLVPEGRTDFDLLQLLVDAVELRTERTPELDNEVPQFGTMVGVVPTPDAQVESVFKQLAKIHRRVVCLVDGDREGNNYVRGLISSSTPPAKVLQWPENWTIEDILGWIGSADENILPKLSRVFNSTMSGFQDFVTILKDQPRDGGAKGDAVAYERCIAVLAESPNSLARVKLCLRRLAVVCNSDADPPDWIRSDRNAPVYRFSL